MIPKIIGVEAENSVAWFTSVLPTCVNTGIYVVFFLNTWVHDVCVTVVACFVLNVMEMSHMHRR